MSEALILREYEDSVLVVSQQDGYPVTRIEGLVERLILGTVDPAPNLVGELAAKRARPRRAPAKLNY